MTIFNRNTSDNRNTPDNRPPAESRAPEARVVPSVPGRTPETRAIPPTPSAPTANTNERTPMPEATMPTPPSSPEQNRAQTVARPINTVSAVSMTSHISKATKISGQIESSENIQIDGQIDGDVRGVNVKVGNGAKVKGTVYGDEVELAGAVEGKIEAKRVVLTSTAHMSGDVIHSDIRIDSGAFIDGHCKPEFGKAPASSSKTQPALKAVAGTEKTG